MEETGNVGILVNFENSLLEFTFAGRGSTNANVNYKNSNRSLSIFHYHRASIRLALRADANSIASWQGICHCFRVDPLSDNFYRSLTGTMQLCSLFYPSQHSLKHAVFCVQVNIVDPLEFVRSGAAPEHLTTGEDSKEYTTSDGRFLLNEEDYGVGIL
jgi:hypothetical protein